MALKRCLAIRRWRLKKSSISASQLEQHRRAREFFAENTLERTLRSGRRVGKQWAMAYSIWAEKYRRVDNYGHPCVFPLSRF